MKKSKASRYSRYYISFIIIFIIGSAFFLLHHIHGQGHTPERTSLKYGNDPKQTLDLYRPDEISGKKFPVIIYVHGGGWTGGDKSNVAEKTAYFTHKGYVFISLNYRLYPKASYTDMADDVAKAVKWIYDHAGQYHLDRGKLNLMGHSAGGHLVMLIGTNPKYLHNAGLSLQSIHSIVCLEGPVDLNDFISRLSQYKKVFGSDPKVWAEASPVTYASNKNLPPMFMVAHGNRSIAGFIEKARIAGNTVESFSVRTLSNSGVTAELGSVSGSEEAKNMTNAVTAFLKKYNP
ncbi:alpha/beta hydrolase [Neobacillus fumarioli]|uniref:alpha/beta hydrolase n=1 Tax=Neobacillus fumarioli TaxID=105229 RepID=UPI0008311FF0|nr:alpha/beta hydrolase [Neobacillus fumarioli]